MKVVIELSDEVLKKAVEYQVGEALSKITGEVVKEKAEAIIATKLERFEPGYIAERHVEKMVEDRVDALLESLLGKNRFDQRDKLNALLQKAAMRMLAEAAKS